MVKPDDDARSMAIISEDPDGRRRAGRAVIRTPTRKSVAGRNATPTF